MFVENISKINRYQDMMHFNIIYTPPMKTYSFQSASGYISLLLYLLTPDDFIRQGETPRTGKSQEFKFTSKIRERWLQSFVALALTHVRFNSWTRLLKPIVESIFCESKFSSVIIMYFKTQSWLTGENAARWPSAENPITDHANPG